MDTAIIFRLLTACMLLMTSFALVDNSGCVPHQRSSILVPCRSLLLFHSIFFFFFFLKKLRSFEIFVFFESISQFLFFELLPVYFNMSIPSLSHLVTPSLIQKFIPTHLIRYLFFFYLLQLLDSEHARLLAFMEFNRTNLP